MLKPYHLACALAAAMMLAGCEEEPQERNVIRPVLAAKVADAEGFSERSFPGRARATARTNVSFEVAGRMSQRPVVVGDVVEEGQLLAKLDPRDFENALAQAEAEKARATAQRDRTAEAAAVGAVSRQELTDAEAQVQKAEAEVLLRAKALEDSTVFAPHGGSIVATYVENFENVQAKQVIMRLVDDSKIEMVIDVPEHLIGGAQYVTDIQVVFDVFPDTVLKAEIKEIGSEASEATRTFPVTMIMEPPEGVDIRAGMAGRVSARVDLPEEDVFILIPASSVFSDADNQNSYVWVIDEATKTVSRRQVTRGQLSSRGIVIDKGLDVGEWIATAGVHSLVEGQEVRIIQAPPLPEDVGRRAGG